MADQAAYLDTVPKVVVAGIPSASAALVGLARAVGRRVAQIEVPRMPPQELNEILVRGEQRLRLYFEGDARDEIIGLCDGFPYYVHLFALHTTERAVEGQRDRVTIEDFEGSLRDVLAVAISS